MFSKIELAKKYIQYWTKANNGKGHGTHSPFVYDFIRKVLMDKSKNSDFDKIEHLRKQLRKDNTLLEIKDFGAGSRVDGHKKRAISSIAKSALKPAKYSQLFYRIIQHYNYQNRIELGTSLGITTSYLSSANTKGKVFTFEGAPSVAEVALKNFSNIGLQNITLTEGNFDETLPLFLKQLEESGEKLDFSFIDGNHREKPTIDYYEQILPFSHNNSVIILDDIHWSQGMENAWYNIIKREEVSLSIDLFFIGLVFFRKENKQKEHFTIRY
ncbi:MAG: SAM-dependent methyltransferase [Pseudopedobacter saltans]|uniref:SAM-dependent methyltransferase n=1 Tax=Pseudopedobacter saltans TaxID=151895 RepID=A0A2W5EUY8_9SPHI|nr:MAG: SAM-dependent methyltransferase [Pseudopedobacter saltans]